VALSNAPYDQQIALIWSLRCWRFAAVPVTDFVSRRDRRVTEPEKNANQLDIEFETGRAAARWIRAMERFDPVELFLYSLTSAAALSAVLMGFLCMADFARQSASEASDPVSQELTGSGDPSYGGHLLVKNRPN